MQQDLRNWNSRKLTFLRLSKLSCPRVSSVAKGSGGTSARAWQSHHTHPFREFLWPFVRSVCPLSSCPRGENGGWEKRGDLAKGPRDCPQTWDLWLWRPCCQLLMSCIRKHIPGSFERSGRRSPRGQMVLTWEELGAVVPMLTTWAGWDRGGAGEMGCKTWSTRMKSSPCEGCKVT